MWTPVYFSARAGRVDGCQDAVLSSQQDGQRAESGGEGGPDQRRGSAEDRCKESASKSERMREGHWKMDKRGCERERDFDMNDKVRQMNVEVLVSFAWRQGRLVTHKGWSCNRGVYGGFQRGRDANAGFRPTVKVQKKFNETLLLS